MNALLGSREAVHSVTEPDIDPTVIWLVAALLGLSAVMVYSASIAIAEAARYSGGQAHYFFLRHVISQGVGIVAAIVVFQIPMRCWQMAAPYLFMACVALLFIVLIPGVGREVNGSQRWLGYGSFSLQPSELTKLCVVLYAADYTVRKAAHMASLRKAFLPMFTVMLLTGALLLQEPDFGAFAVMTVIAMGILFLGGMNWRLFALLVFLLVSAFVILIWSSPYRMERVLGFMDPWADPFGRGYQLSHALIAFGRGEWLGVGLGASVEKLFYLPEAHTDFLLAVIAEELGFVGVVATIGVFAWLCLRAVSIGNQAARLDRYFSALVAQGVGLWIAVQTMINMGVNMGLLPTKGLTLPLLSYGGSSLVANCMALGLLLRVDFENRQLMKGYTL
jgi:cell division protein FtsW